MFSVLNVFNGIGVILFGLAADRYDRPALLCLIYGMRGITYIFLTLGKLFWFGLVWVEFGWCWHRYTSPPLAPILSSRQSLPAPGSEQSVLYAFSIVFGIFDCELVLSLARGSVDVPSVDVPTVSNPINSDSHQQPFLPPKPDFCRRCRRAYVWLDRHHVRTQGA